MPEYFLSIIIFLPLFSALIILALKRNSSIIWLSTVTSALTTVLSAGLFLSFDSNESGFQFVHWIPDLIVSGKLSVDYMVGLDGVGLLLFFLTSFLFFLSSLTTWKNITKRIKEFHFFLLLLETAVLGIFSSLNLVQFYVFWELMVIPMALMVGIWGSANRIRAAVKYLVFSMAGSLLMLAGILILYYKTGTTSIEALSVFTLDPYTPGLKLFVFCSFALAFAIKIPIFPLHTWMPDVHSEAPTVGSVDLAGVLLKLGVFGFIRFLIPFFPTMSLEFRDIFSILAVIGILWGAWAAMSQKDSKRLIAYSSLSHLGFTLLGLMSFTEIGVAGGMLQLISHGVSTGMLFILLGIYHDRTHKRMIEDMGGVAKTMPIFSIFFVIAMLSSVGLPGTNGFVGELLILLGSIKADWLLGGIAATGVIWASLYLLRFTKSFLFGPAKDSVDNPPRDLDFREYVILIPFVIAIFAVGL
ncbi:MAG: NADH-quinone oxidoreductase subunit M, partial [Leptospira sp.]|nr:NADH-quinone oxidoreductase subunit M [Leptospira sp.]